MLRSRTHLGYRLHSTAHLANFALLEVFEFCDVALPQVCVEAVAG
jgi:hypothetical protein